MASPVPRPMPMLTLAALDSRRSVPTRQLGTPGPDPDQLLRILRSASRVPDHGKRVPFRFLRVAGVDRARLADAASARLREREPEASEAALDKLRTRFLMPPLTLCVVARLGPDEKIPESERLATASCVCLLLLQAAQAEGIGAQWLTGLIAYDRAFLEGMKAAGAEGYVLKDAAFEDLTAAIRQILDGGTFFPNGESQN